MCGMIQAKRRRREKKRPETDLHSQTDGHPEKDAKEKEAVPMGQAQRHAGAIHREYGKGNHAAI